MFLSVVHNYAPLLTSKRLRYQYKKYTVLIGDVMFLKCLLLLTLIKYSCGFPKKPSIIIVGAGAAGISAATRLLHNNFYDVIILEAQDRIGGRIHTFDFGDGVVDLGARHCMGTEGNVVYETLKNMDILTDMPFANEVYHSGKGRLNNGLSKKIFKMWEWGDPRLLVGNDYGNISFATYINLRFSKEKSELDVDESTKRSVLRMLMRYTLRETGPHDPYTRPITINYKDVPGGHFVFSKYGYIIYLETLINNLPTYKQELFHRNLKFRKVVERIEWLQCWGGKLSVKCGDGSVYVADHVIFTPSVNVLKRNHKSMFLPQLPKFKRDAIEVIEMGSQYKHTVHFPKRWWPENFYGSLLLWDDEDIKRVRLEFPLGVLKNGYVWLSDIVAFTAEKNNTNVLSSWIGSRYVIEIEQLNDRTIVQGLMYTLNKFFGRYFNITNPDGYASDKQWLNPYLLGGYSFDTFKTGKYSHVDLMRPLVCYDGRPLVLFAGEATHRDHFQTVHGASETGFREADRIINFYKNK